MDHNISPIRLDYRLLFIFENNLKKSGMGVWRQIAEYLYLKKKDANADNSGWIKYMHGINRISIFMFLLALLIIIIRILFLKKH